MTRGGKSLAAVFAGVFVLAACANENRIGAYSDITDDGFSLQALAPKEEIQSYAFCKAVRFAEAKKAATLYLGPPEIKVPDVNGEAWKSTGAKSPEDWLMLTGRVYLKAELAPPGTPPVDVAAMAEDCRKIWSWYR